MSMTQTVHAYSTYALNIELGTPLRPKCQIIISAILQHVAHTCHLSSTQLVIGAAPVVPLPALSSTLIFKVSYSVRLTSLSEESASLTAIERLWEANLIRGLAALPAAFQARLLG